jgi:nucleoside 2-deoxyribosyltransferase
MEFVSDGESWRDKVSDTLTQMGVVCFDPYKKPFESDIKEDKESQNELREKRANGNLQDVHDHMREIIAADLAMVDRADFIIAYLNPDVPTFGTIHEIVVANQAKKPIFVFVEGGVKKTPLWMLGLLPVKYFYDDLDSLLKTIVDIDSGRKQIDSKRWRLFKEEYR